MSDWFADLPVMSMAFLVFGLTYFAAEFGLLVSASCAHSRTAQTGLTQPK